MAATSKATASANTVSASSIFNLPNQLTLTRLGLSIVLFVLIAYRQFLAGVVVFSIAAATDWLDGYFARKWGQITVFGRILDPFVDKIIICGTFVFLAAEPQSFVRPWMAVLVVGRELLITAIRGFLEEHGSDFSAQMSGKLKMALQCLASVASMVWLDRMNAAGEAPAANQPGAVLVMLAVWAAVGMTVYSGVAYLRAAWRKIAIG